MVIDSFFFNHSLLLLGIGTVNKHCFSLLLWYYLEVLKKELLHTMHLASNLVYYVTECNC